MTFPEMFSFSNVLSVSKSINKMYFSGEWLRYIGARHFPYQTNKGLGHGQWINNRWIQQPTYGQPTDR